MAKLEEDKKKKVEEPSAPAPILSQEELPAEKKPVDEVSPAADTTTPPAVNDDATNKTSEDVDATLAEMAKMDGPAGDKVRQMLGINNEKKYEQEVIQGYDNQITDMNSFIGQMQENVRKTEAEASEEQTAKKKMFASDVTEAVAALANLIGTTQGAKSQQWTSPHQTWVQRVDTLRKERETKLNSYRTQLNSLQQAKRQLQQAKASTALGYERLRSQESNNVAKLELEGQKLQQKIITADKTLAAKLAALDEKKVRDIYKDALSRWGRYYSGQITYGNDPGSAETVMKKFIEQAMEAYDSIEKSIGENKEMTDLLTKNGFGAQ